MGDTFDLHKQIEAAKLLKAQMADLLASDPEFMLDVIEGETTLHEELCALTISVREDDALADSIAKLISDLQARKQRIEGRSDLKRSLIALGMAEGGIKKLETPAGTITRKAVAPKVIVTEEADVPTRFWKMPDPTLDKKALGEALKARQQALSDAAALDDPAVRELAVEAVEAMFPAIPGASLSNGGETIQIRG